MNPTGEKGEVEKEEEEDEDDDDEDEEESKKIGRAIDAFSRLNCGSSEARQSKIK